MSPIITFIKALLPRVEKSTIEEDVRTTLKELEQAVLPSYQMSGQHFRTTPLASEEGLALQTMYYRERELRSKGPNFIVDIGEDLARAKINLTFLQKKVADVLEADLINEGLTVLKAHILRSVGKISYISRFSLDLLNHVVAQEGAKKGGTAVEVSPQQRTYIDGGVKGFFRSLNDFAMEPKDFEKLFSELPDVVVTSKNASSITSVFKAKDLDPFTAGDVHGFSGNPIYHVRLLVTEWQAKRYNANKDKKRLLELRLLHLKSLVDGKPNARLEQEITYLESRVEKLDRQIRATEESLEGV